MGDEKMFLKAFKDRLLGVFQSDWNEEICHNDRYTLYSTFKSQFSLSVYLNEIRHIKARNYLIRTRLGVSQLNVHRLRFVSEAGEIDLLCPACGSREETEIHFVLICPKYKDIRERFIAKKYYNSPSLFKLTMLFASETKSIMIGLANYLLNAFEVRNTLR